MIGCIQVPKGKTNAPRVWRNWEYRLWLFPTHSLYLSSIASSHHSRFLCLKKLSPLVLRVLQSTGLQHVSLWIDQNRYSGRRLQEHHSDVPRFRAATVQSRRLGNSECSYTRSACIVGTRRARPVLCPTPGFVRETGGRRRIPNAKPVHSTAVFEVSGC